MTVVFIDIIFSAIQLARLSGFSQIISIAATRSADLLRALGATHALDRSLPSAELLSQVQEIASVPIEVVYDAFSSPETQSLGYDILAPGGTLAITLPSALDEFKLHADKSVYFVYGAPHHPEYEEIDAGFFEVLPEYLASEEIKASSYVVNFHLSCH